MRYLESEMVALKIKVDELEVISACERPRANDWICEVC